MSGNMRLLMRFPIIKNLVIAPLFAVLALFSIPSVAEIVYYHNDLLGSPIAATNASGQVIWRESYRPYGERIQNDAASTDNKMWFTSRHQDVDTGLSYMGARYYDPMLGRFLSIDPVLFNEKNIHSFGRYTYGNNNPYRFLDPDGKEAKDGFCVSPGDCDPITAERFRDQMQGARDAAEEVFKWWSIVTITVGGGLLEEGLIGGGEIILSRTAPRIIAQDGTAVTGFAKHGINRAIGDGAKIGEAGSRAGTKPGAILDALKNPKKIKEGVDSKGRPFKTYSGKDGRVVINPKTGEIVSTNPTGRAGAH